MFVQGDAGAQAGPHRIAARARRGPGCRPALPRQRCRQPQVVDFMSENSSKNDSAECRAEGGAGGAHREHEDQQVADKRLHERVPDDARRRSRRWRPCSRSRRHWRCSCERIPGERRRRKTPRRDAACGHSRAAPEPQRDRDRDRGHLPRERPGDPGPRTRRWRWRALDLRLRSRPSPAAASVPGARGAAAVSARDRRSSSRSPGGMMDTSACFSASRPRWMSVLTLASVTSRSAAISR